MDTLQARLPASDRTQTSAHARAAQNLDLNLAALEQTQPRMAALARAAVEHGSSPLEWVLGRDGALTARDAEGRWWAGCSVPVRAAREMLKSLESRGTLGCFLAPPLAAHVRVALDAAESNQAVLVVQPDAASLRVLLGSEDFSRDISANRLWFACGDEWPGEMRRLFDERPGLPTPTQFIRLPGTDAEQIEQLIQCSQAVFAQVITARAAQIRCRCLEWRPAGQSPRRVCIVAGTRFRLWDDAGLVLRELVMDKTASEVDWRILDADDPASAAPARLAELACDCEGLVTASTSRADAPELVPTGLPWLTWATTPGRVPSGAAAGPNDVLLVVDEACRELAVSRGWPAGRVEVAGWPALGEAQGPGATSRGEGLGLIADTMSIVRPARLDDYSSHAMLWETIRRELGEHPGAVGTDAGEYLKRQIRSYGVAEEGLDRTLFIERLIRPAFAQAVARSLIGAGLPLRLFGEGWSRLDEFAAHSRGSIGSRAELAKAVADSRVLVHCWPERHAHPIEFTGRPVIRAAKKPMRALMVEAREALRRGPAGCVSLGPILSGGRLAECLVGFATRTIAA